MGKMIGCAKELEGLYYLETKSGNGGHGSHPHFSEKVPSNIYKFGYIIFVYNILLLLC